MLNACSQSISSRSKAFLNQHQHARALHYLPLLASVQTFNWCFHLDLVDRNWNVWAPNSHGGNANAALGSAVGRTQVGKDQRGGHAHEAKHEKHAAKRCKVPTWSEAESGLHD